jgi:hypothetical protein
VSASERHSVELQRHLAVILKRLLSSEQAISCVWVIIIIIYSARSTTHVTRGSLRRHYSRVNPPCQLHHPLTISIVSILLRCSCYYLQ